MALPRPQRSSSREFAKHLERTDRGPDGKLIPADQVARRMNTGGGYTDPVGQEGPIDPLTGDDYNKIREGTHLPRYPRHFVEAHARARNIKEGSTDYKEGVRGIGHDIVADKLGEEYADFVSPPRRPRRS